MKTKTESMGNVENVVQPVKTAGYRILCLHLDGETSLQSNPDGLAGGEGARAERRAPQTPAQNGHSRAGGKWIVVRVRAFAREAQLPQPPWPQIIVTVGSLMSGTPGREPNWKTPFESVFKLNPLYSYLDILGSGVYAPKQNIPKLHKLTERAYIGHLWGWESTDIFGTWIPGVIKVIGGHDVMIDSGNLYSPYDLDANSLNETSIENTVQALE